MIKESTLFKNLRQTTASKIRDIFDRTDLDMGLVEYFDFPNSCLEAQTFDLRDKL